MLLTRVCERSKLQSRSQRHTVYRTLSKEEVCPQACRQTPEGVFWDETVWLQPAAPRRVRTVKQSVCERGFSGSLCIKPACVAQKQSPVKAARRIETPLKSFITLSKHISPRCLLTICLLDCDSVPLNLLKQTVLAFKQKLVISCHQSREVCLIWESVRFCLGFYFLERRDRLVVYVTDRHILSLSPWFSDSRPHWLKLGDLHKDVLFISSVFNFAFIVLLLCREFICTCLRLLVPVGGRREVN